MTTAALSHDFPLESLAILRAPSSVDHLWELASRHPSLQATRLTDASGRSIDRFVFRGPTGGGERIRIGIFAGIHGDEPAGILATQRLLESLTTRPALAEGYELFVYPICNPTGVAAGSRHSASGRDLNREFWKNSDEPEVRLLEAEIRAHAFHGLVSLHSDDTSEGVYGFVRGAVLAKALVEPALCAAEKHLPRNAASVIDGFPAERGVITTCYEGILAAPPSVRLDPEPFEIIFETPHHAPQELQVQASLAALETILNEYQRVLAFAANL